MKICAAGLHIPFADTSSHAFPLNLLQNSFFAKADPVYRSNDHVTEWQVSIPHILEQ